MPRNKNYKKKRVYKKRYNKKSKKGLSSTEVKQVKNLVEKAIMADDEWGYLDPPYNFKGYLNATGTTMIFSPVQSGTFTGNTAFQYHSNHGIITECHMATHLGNSGIETREGTEITVRRILFRLQCSANPALEYKNQSFRIHVLRQPKDILAAMDSAELTAYWNDVMKTIKRPGLIGSDLTEDQKAIKKTYKINKTFSENVSLISDGAEFVGLKKNSSYMLNVDWPFNYTVTTSESVVSVEPEDYLLFFIIQWGGYENVLDSTQYNINLMPEFNLTANVWYTT